MANSSGNDGIRFPVYIDLKGLESVDAAKQNVKGLTDELTILRNAVKALPDDNTIVDSLQKKEYTSMVDTLEENINSLMRLRKNIDVADNAEDQSRALSQYNFGKGYVRNNLNMMTKEIGQYFGMLLSFTDAQAKIFAAGVKSIRPQMTDAINQSAKVMAATGTKGKNQIIDSFLKSPAFEQMWSPLQQAHPEIFTKKIAEKYLNSSFLSLINKQFVEEFTGWSKNDYVKPDHFRLRLPSKFRSLPLVRNPNLEKLEKGSTLLSSNELALLSQWIMDNPYLADEAELAGIIKRYNGRVLRNPNASRAHVNAFAGNLLRLFEAGERGSAGNGIIDLEHQRFTEDQLISLRNKSNGAISHSLHGARFLQDNFPWLVPKYTEEQKPTISERWTNLGSYHSPGRQRRMSLYQISPEDVDAKGNIRIRTRPDSREVDQAQFQPMVYNQVFDAIERLPAKTRKRLGIQSFEHNGFSKDMILVQVPVEELEDPSISDERKASIQQDLTRAMSKMNLDGEAYVPAGYTGTHAVMMRKKVRDAIEKNNPGFFSFGSVMPKEGLDYSSFLKYMDYSRKIYTDVEPVSRLYGTDLGKARVVVANMKDITGLDGQNIGSKQFFPETFLSRGFRNKGTTQAVSLEDLFANPNSPYYQYYNPETDIVSLPKGGIKGGPLTFKLGETALIEDWENIKTRSAYPENISQEEIDRIRTEDLRKRGWFAKTSVSGFHTNAKFISSQEASTLELNQEARDYFANVALKRIADLQDPMKAIEMLFSGDDTLSQLVSNDPSKISEPLAQERIEQEISSIFKNIGQGRYMLPENAGSYAMLSAWIPNIINGLIGEENLTPEQKAVALNGDEIAYLKDFSSQIWAFRNPSTIGGNITSDNRANDSAIQWIANQLGLNEEDRKSLFVNPAGTILKAMQGADLDSDTAHVTPLRSILKNNKDNLFGQIMRTVLADTAIRNLELSKDGGYTDEELEELESLHAKEAETSKDRYFANDTIQGISDMNDWFLNTFGKAGRMGYANAVSLYAHQYPMSPLMKRASQASEKDYDYMSVFDVKKNKKWVPTEDEKKVINGGAPFFQMFRWARDAEKTLEENYEESGLTRGTHYFDYDTFFRRNVDKVNFPSIYDSHGMETDITSWMSARRNPGMMKRLGYDWEDIFEHAPNVDENSHVGQYLKEMRMWRAKKANQEFLLFDDDLVERLINMAENARIEIAENVAKEGFTGKKAAKEIKKRFAEIGGNVPEFLKKYGETRSNILGSQYEQDIVKLAALFGEDKIFGGTGVEIPEKISPVIHSIEEQQNELTAVSKKIAERKAALQKEKEQLTKAQTVETPKQEESQPVVEKPQSVEVVTQEKIPTNKPVSEGYVSPIQRPIHRGNFLGTPTVVQTDRENRVIPGSYLGNQNAVIVPEDAELASLEAKKANIEKSIEMYTAYQSSLQQVREHNQGLHKLTGKQMRELSDQSDAAAFIGLQKGLAGKLKKDINESFFKKYGDDLGNIAGLSGTDREILRGEIEQMNENVHDAILNQAKLYSKNFSESLAKDLGKVEGEPSQRRKTLDKHKETYKQIGEWQNELLNERKSTTPTRQREIDETLDWLSAQKKEQADSYAKLGKLYSDQVMTENQFDLDKLQQAFGVKDKYSPEVISASRLAQINDVRQKVEQRYKDKFLNEDQYLASTNILDYLDSISSVEAIRKDQAMDDALFNQKLLSDNAITNSRNSYQLNQMDFAADQYKKQQMRRFNRSRIAQRLFGLEDRKTSLQQQIGSWEESQKEAREQQKVYDLAVKNYEEKHKDKDLTNDHEYQQLLHTQSKGNDQISHYGDMIGKAKKELDDLSTSGAKAQAVFGALGDTIGQFAQRLGHQLFNKAIQETKQFIQQFDASMNEIQAITLKSDVQMQDIRSQTVGKAIGLRTSVSNVATTEAALYRQGLSDQEVSERTDAIIKFATVTKLNVSEATKIITTALQNDLVPSAAQAMDALVALGDSAATTAAEIGKGMQKAAASAKVAGVSYAELTALLTIGTSDTQLSGTQVGTALQTVFTRMRRLTTSGYTADQNGEKVTSNEAEAALKAVGIDLWDDKKIGKMRSAYEVMSDLSKVWQNLSDAQKSIVTSALAGTRQTNVFSTLMEGMSEDGGATLDKYLGLAEGSNGITQTKYEIAMKSLAATMDELKSSWDAVVESFTNSNLITGTLDTLSGFLQRLSSISNPGVILAGIAAGIAAIAVSLNAVELGPIGQLLTLLAALGTFAIGSTVIGGIESIFKPETEAEKRAKEFDKLSSTQEYRNEYIADRESKIENVKKLGEAYDKLKDSQDQVAKSEASNKLVAGLRDLESAFPNLSEVIKDSISDLDNWSNAVNGAQNAVTEFKKEHYNQTNKELAGYWAENAQAEYNEYVDQAKSNLFTISDDRRKSISDYLKYWQYVDVNDRSQSYSDQRKLSALNASYDWMTAEDKAAINDIAMGIDLTKGSQFAKQGIFSVDEEFRQKVANELFRQLYGESNNTLTADDLRQLGISFVEESMLPKIDFEPYATEQFNADYIKQAFLNKFQREINNPESQYSFFDKDGRLNASVFSDFYTNELANKYGAAKTQAQRNKLANDFAAENLKQTDYPYFIRTNDDKNFIGFTSYDEALEYVRKNNLSYEDILDENGKSAYQSAQKALDAAIVSAGEKKGTSNLVQAIDNIKNAKDLQSLFSMYDQQGLGQELSNAISSSSELLGAYVALNNGAMSFEEFQSAAQEIRPGRASRVGIANNLLGYLQNGSISTKEFRTSNVYQGLYDTFKSFYGDQADDIINAIEDGTFTENADLQEYITRTNASKAIKQGAGVKQFTNKETARLAQRVLGYNTLAAAQEGLVNEWTTDEWDAVLNKYPELQRYMQMSEEQKGSVEGQNLLKNMQIEFDVAGVSDLEEAGKIAEGTAEKLERLQKGGHIAIEVEMQMRSEAYASGQQRSKLYNGTAEEQAEAAMSILQMGQDEYYARIGKGEDLISQAKQADQQQQILDADTWTTIYNNSKDKQTIANLAKSAGFYLDPGQQRFIYNENLLPNVDHSDLFAGTFKSYNNRELTEARRAILNGSLSNTKGDYKLYQAAESQMTQAEKDYMAMRQNPEKYTETEMRKAEAAAVREINKATNESWNNLFKTVADYQKGSLAIKDLSSQENRQTLSGLIGMDESRIKEYYDSGDIQPLLDQLGETYKDLLNDPLIQYIEELSDIDLTDTNDLESLIDKLYEAAKEVGGRTGELIEYLAGVLQQAADAVSETDVSDLGAMMQKGIEALSGAKNKEKNLNWLMNNVDNIDSMVTEDKDRQTALAELAKSSGISDWSAFTSDAGLMAATQLWNDKKFTTEQYKDVLENSFYGTERSSGFENSLMKGLFNTDNYQFIDQNGRFNEVAFGETAESKVKALEEFKSAYDSLVSNPYTGDFVKEIDGLNEVVQEISDKNYDKAIEGFKRVNEQMNKKQADNASKYGKGVSGVAEAMALIKNGGKDARIGTAMLNKEFKTLQNQAAAVKKVMGGMSGDQMKKEREKNGDKTSSILADMIKQSVEDIESMSSSELQQIFDEEFSGGLDEEFASTISQMLNSVLEGQEVTIDMNKIHANTDGSIDLSEFAAACEGAAADILAQIAAMAKNYGSITLQVDENGNVISVKGVLDAAGGSTAGGGGGGGGGGGKSKVDKLLEEQKRRVTEVQHRTKMLEIYEKSYDYLNDYSGWDENIDDQISTQHDLYDVYKRNIDEMQGMMASVKQGSDDWYKLRDAIYEAEEAMAEIGNTIKDLNAKKIEITADKFEERLKPGSHIQSLLDSYAQRAMSEDRFADYERFMLQQREEKQSQRSENTAQIEEWKEELAKYEKDSDAWRDIRDKIWEKEEENAQLDAELVQMQLDLNSERLSQISKVVQQNTQTSQHNLGIYDMYQGAYESGGYRKQYEGVIKKQLSENERLISENMTAEQAAKDQMKTLQKGTTAWFEAQAAVYSYQEAIAQTKVTQMELNRALAQSRLDSVAESYEDKTRSVNHVNEMLEAQAQEFLDTNDFEAYYAAMDKYIKNIPKQIKANQSALTTLRKQYDAGMEAGTLDPAMQREYLDQIIQYESEIQRLEIERDQKRREVDKQRDEQMFKNMNWSQSEFQHNENLLNYQMTTYQNKDELTNVNNLIEADNDLRKSRIKTIDDEIKKLKERQDYYKKTYGEGTEEEKRIVEQIKKDEEERAKLTSQIDKNTKALEENRKKILQTRKTLEDSVDKEIEAQKKREREMLASNVSMQNTILELLKKRLQDEWALKKKDIDKEKESLNEYKKLINERFNYRKKAAQQADKEEELAEYRRQLALIQADPTRTKDAKELKRKIDDLQEEISWTIAEDELSAENERIDDQVEGMNKFVQYNEELLAEILGDANNFSTEINDILTGSFEESYNKILEFMQKENEAFMKSLPDAQKQMIQTWEDTWKKANDIIDSNYSDIQRILDIYDSEGNLKSYDELSKSKYRNRYLKYMRSNNRNYRLYQENGDQTSMALLERQWSEYFDNFLNAIKDTASFTPDEHTLGEVTSAISKLDDDLYKVDDKKITGTAEGIYGISTDYTTTKDLSTGEQLIHEDLDDIYKVAEEIRKIVTETPEERAKKAAKRKGEEPKMTFTGTALVAYYTESGLQSFQGSATSPFTQFDAYQKAVEQALDAAEKAGATAGGGFYAPGSAVYKEDKDGNVIIDGRTYSVLEDSDRFLKKAYASGGLVDYTGPAWVDGTKTKPEAFLNSIDTENIRLMLDAFDYIKTTPYMSHIDSSMFGQNTNVGDINITINQAELKDDADFDFIAKRVGEAFTKEISRQGLNLSGYAF